ncbi:MAG: tetratricopeptide repeat protein [Candidatus Omnitrophica bacterium]|nr:tetratricopeptide repeat protein [Candidatus Omnitrophota bacterium]
MPKERLSAAAFAIFLVTFVVYLPALNSGFLWDDYPLIVSNPHLKNLSGLTKVWFDLFSHFASYYPLTVTSFWLEYRFWQLEPFGYHLTNILLHAANASFLLLLLRRLKIPGASLAAAVFALHPIQVESVVWISERRNVLSLFFYLLAALSYVRFYNLDGPSGHRTYRVGFYVGVLFFFLCSVLSKSTACSFPPVALLLLWWKGKKIWWRDLLLLVPIVIASLGIGFITILLERINFGAEGINFAWSFWDRLLITSKAFWFYIGKLLWPSNLSLIYPRWEVYSISPWYFIWVILTAAGLFALRKIVSREKWKGLLAAVLFFSINLIPISGFFNVSFFVQSFVANRWLYLPSIGLFALTGFVWQKFFGHRAFLTKSVLLSVFLLTIGALTSARLFDFQDEKTIWMDTIQKNPKSAWARFHLGFVFQRKGEIEGAINQYAEAIKLDPTHVHALNNLGVIMYSLGRFDQAEILFSEVARHRSNNDSVFKNLFLARVKKSVYNSQVRAD